MSVIDLHCDTIYEIYHSKSDINLYKNHLKVDILKMQNSGILAQVFALFVDAKELKAIGKSPMEYILEMQGVFKAQMDKNNRYISSAQNYDDIIRNSADNKISALLSIEGGEVLEGRLEHLKVVYDLGVRILTLTWNYENEIGCPHTLPSGLTSFGKEVVEYMNELKMLIDVSHLSDKGFYDVVDMSTKPIIASHSNSRMVHPHTRNLTDDMVRAIANSGGIIGINLYGEFLGKDGSTINNIMDHIMHIHKVGGIESIALGGDFDGFIGESEVYNSSEWSKLITRLQNSVISEEYIDKIMYKNALRVIKDVL